MRSFGAPEGRGSPEEEHLSAAERRAVRRAERREAERRRFVRMLRWMVVSPRHFLFVLLVAAALLGGLLAAGGFVEMDRTVAAHGVLARGPDRALVFRGALAAEALGLVAVGQAAIVLSDSPGKEPALLSGRVARTLRPEEAGAGFAGGGGGWNVEVALDPALPAASPGAESPAVPAEARIVVGRERFLLRVLRGRRPGRRLKDEG